MKISRFRVYYALTKPGIVYGNTLTAAAGFFIGSHGRIDFLLFLSTLLGIASVIAAGCVINNYIDRDIDAKMERTKNRALVTGVVAPKHALILGAILSLVGVLFLLVNLKALLVALVGLFVYIVVYSLWSKRNTLHATLLGAVAGAAPPVVGYIAASNTVDVGALIVFLIMFTWQLPHALAIAIRRASDYSAASVPVMPLVRGNLAAKMQMLIYVLAWSLATLSLYVYGFEGVWYLSGLGVLNAGWIVLSVWGFWTKDDVNWAKQMFIYSLVLNLAFCLLAVLDVTRF